MSLFYVQVHAFERSSCRIIIIIFDGRDFTRVPVTKIGQKSSRYLKRGLIFDNRVAFGNSLASVLPVCFRLCCCATSAVCPSLYLATFRRR